MFFHQNKIRTIALRIEHAYCRKYPQWNAAGLTPGVWEAAAARLIEASEGRSGLPVDPEFYVAVQPSSRMYPDPWSELTQQRSLRRYVRSLKRIVTRLRRELTEEITRGECRMLRGLELEHVLETEGSKISPLSRYILSLRAGRQDLSVLHHAAALDQHRACPLYRLAALSLLPGNKYPSMNLVDEPSSHAKEIVEFSRN